MRKRRHSVSNSFSEIETTILADILRILLRGGDPSMYARRPEFKHIVRKQEAMSAKLEELRGDSTSDRDPRRRERDSSTTGRKTRKVAT